MSFIFENNDLLFKFSQVVEQPNDIQLKNKVGLYLLNNLKSQLSSPITSEFSENINATSGDFDNLSQFARWMADNKLLWKNQKLAWQPNERFPDTAYEVLLPNNKDVAAYINKPATLEYLTYLRDNKTVNNKPLQLKLSNIIRDINSTILEKNEKPLSVVPATKPLNVNSPNTKETSSVQNNTIPQSQERSINQNSEQTSDQMSNIISSLPLDINDVDFNRIRNFFSLYNRIVSKDNMQSSIASMGTAIKAMNTASNLTSSNQQIFRLTRDVKELIAWLKPPAGDNALQFLDALQQVVVETGKILGMFYNEFARTLYSKDRATFNNEQKSLIEAQYLGPNSIYSQNLREIQSLIANVERLLNVKK